VVVQGVISGHAYPTTDIPRSQEIAGQDIHLVFGKLEFANEVATVRGDNLRDIQLQGILAVRPLESHRTSTKELGSRHSPYASSK